MERRAKARIPQKEIQANSLATSVSSNTGVPGGPGKRMILPHPSGHPTSSWGQSSQMAAKVKANPQETLAMSGASRRPSAESTMQARPTAIVIHRRRNEANVASLGAAGRLMTGSMPFKAMMSTMIERAAIRA